MVSVTHRLAAARTADLIVVLDQGRVVERGTHEQLLAQGGLYRALWDKQSGVEVSPDGQHASVDPRCLEAVPLLAVLEPDERAAVVGAMAVVHASAGELVIREGERGERFYLVARGKVVVTAGDTDRPLAVLSDGDFFGELALLSEAPRAASVRALQPCTFLVLEKRQFQSILASNPKISAAVERARAARVVQFTT